MLVEELKANELASIDWNLTRLIPNKCMYCGKPTSINPTLMGLSCSDEFCYSKVARRCVSFLKDLGFIGLGESALRDFCYSFEFYNPVQLFMLEEEDLEGYLEGKAIQRKFKELIKFLDGKREMSLARYLKLAQLPNLQESSADAVTVGYDNIDIFLNTVEVHNVEMIQKALGISDETVSLRSIKIYEQLMLNNEVLRSVVNEGYVTLVQPRTDLEDLTVAISTSAGGRWKTKRDFQEEVTEIFKDKFNINFKGSVTKSTDYLVSEQGVASGKVTKAEKYGIPIVDGEQFIEALNER